jgi:hypothetical protein
LLAFATDVIKLTERLRALSIIQKNLDIDRGIILFT